MRIISTFLFLLLVVVGLSGCGVTSSFDMPKCTHDATLSAKYSGQWVAHPAKENDPTTFLEISPYQLSEKFLRQFSVKQRQEIVDKCQTELFDVAVRVRTVRPQTAETDGALPVPDWAPLAGFFFKYGEHEYLCITWDFPGYVGSDYNLGESLRFIAPRYYVLELTLTAESKLDARCVTLLKPGEKADSAPLPTVDGLRLYNGDIILNSGAEIAAWIEHGQYHCQPYAVFVRENWRQEKEAR